jgi:hypothetical protein
MASLIFDATWRNLTTGPLMYLSDGRQFRYFAALKIVFASRLNARQDARYASSAGCLCVSCATRTQLPRHLLSHHPRLPTT